MARPSVQIPAEKKGFGSRVKPSSMGTGGTKRDGPRGKSKKIKTKTRLMTRCGRR